MNISNIDDLNGGIWYRNIAQLFKKSPSPHNVPYSTQKWQHETERGWVWPQLKIQGNRGIFFYNQWKPFLYGS